MSSNPQAPRSDPSLRPTSMSVLIVAGLVTAALGWLLLSYSYASLPALPWSPVFVLGALAVVEAVLAQNTSARIRRKPGALPPEPLAIARYVALAKASSLVGALFAGFSAGLLAWLALEMTQAAVDDVPAAAGGLITALVLVGTALWLERSCRIPKRPDSGTRKSPDLPPPPL